MAATIGMMLSKFAAVGILIGVAMWGANRKKED